MQKRNIILLSLSATTLLFGAQPNIGDAMRQSEPPKDVPKKKVTLPIVGDDEDKAVQQEIMDGKKILIKHILITGAEHLSNGKLRDIVAPYENTELSFKEMKAIASLLTKTYREEGFFVAKAYIPKQDILHQDGELKISIVEGNYGSFNLDNHSLVNDTLLQEILDDAKDDNVLSLNTLERAMLLINDTPGVKVTNADVKPGTTKGTSDFDIKTESTNPYNAYVIEDNYGSKYTGRYRTNVGLSANSPFGYGDKFGVNGVISSETDLKNGKAYYNFPLMSNGLRGEVSASRTTYTLGDSYASLDAQGKATTLDASLIYPLLRTRVETLNISLDLAHKHMEDEIQSTSDVTKKEAVVGTAGMNYSKESLLFGLNGKTSATFAWAYGDLSFDDNTALASDQAGAKTSGKYSKISGSVEHYLQFDETYALTTSLRFQKALGNKNLDGSEDFSIGGAYGVRAFPDGELSAENGYIFGAELFYTLPSIENISHKVSVFADTGYARMENPTGATDDRHLSDIGLGYQASYKEFFAKAQVARVIGGEKVSSEPEHSTKMLLQIGWMY